VTPFALLETDAAGAVDVIHDAFARQSVVTDPPSGALRETVASIAETLRSGGGFGIRMAEVLAGVVLWQIEDDAVRIGRLAVRPAWRRKGLARALIAACEDEALRRGVPRLRLGVRIELEDNRRLFDSCGYVETCRTAHPGHARPTSITMEKRLDAIAPPHSAGTPAAATCDTAESKDPTRRDRGSAG
jgi:GNAT superfamily N-acetyltransferase